jgi:hypothetical protein
MAVIPANYFLRRKERHFSLLVDETSTTRHGYADKNTEKSNMKNIPLTTHWLNANIICK